MLQTRVRTASGEMLIDVDSAQLPALLREAGNVIWADFNSAEPEELGILTEVFGS